MFKKSAVSTRVFESGGMKMCMLHVHAYIHTATTKITTTPNHLSVLVLPEIYIRSFYNV